MRTKFNFFDANGGFLGSKTISQDLHPIDHTFSVFMNGCPVTFLTDEGDWVMTKLIHRIEEEKILGDLDTYGYKY